MGMSVVASFVDRIEAQVAASALRSAGFNAEVFDQNFSGIDWMAMQALGGIRVSVPIGELDEATRFLRELTQEKPEPGPEPHPGGVWRTAAIAVGVVFPLLALTTLQPQNWWQVAILVVGLIGTPLAWVIVGAAKSRNREGQTLAIASTGLVLALVFTALTALAALILWLPRLLYAGGGM